MMNKPAGVVSATEDSLSGTVLDVLAENLKEIYGDDLSGVPIRDIFPVGRLDKDTVGLLLLTNDGELAHNLLSPKKHVEKRYYVETDLSITRDAADRLMKGVAISEQEFTREGMHHCHYRRQISSGKENVSGCGTESIIFKKDFHGEPFFG